ncbi:MAG: SDR family NAD(P)-dependent oxidoreductase [Actinomycetota bacterium]
MDLNGAHVVITGASRGIGAAMAKAFAAAGANLSLAARSADGLASVADPIGGRVFPVDLLDQDQTEGLVERIEAEAGPIDVLVNNAGVEGTSLVHKVDVDMVRRIARLNLEAPMVLTRQVLPGMLERNRGHLVFTSSLAGTSGFPGLASYGATKAGISNYAAALRLELRDTEIGTTVVAPGPVDTDMWDDVEAAGDIAPVLKRLRLFQLIPIRTPDYLAERTAAAVTGNHRHVRTPRRLNSNHWFREAPSRINEWLMTGVDVGPKRP